MVVFFSWKIRTQESGIKADTELSDQVVGILIGFSVLHFVQEICRSRLGDRSQIGNQVILRHANASISDVQNIVFFISLLQE